MSQPIIIDFPHHARAVLVYRNDIGEIGIQDVAHGCSVLNIGRDLLKHLSDQPYSDAWLTELRDYLTRRLNARAAGVREGYLIQATADGADFVRAQHPQRLEVSDE